MTTLAPQLADAIAAASRSAREMREHLDTVFTLLADQMDNAEDRGHVIMHLLELFADVGWVYALHHQMLKPCAQISGVDLQPLVAAAISQKTDSPKASRDAARAFGHLLREFRGSRGAGEPGSRGARGEEFTACTGLEIERYRQIESGLSEPNLGELSSISAALDKQPSELINRWERMSMIPHAVRCDVLGGTRSK